MHDLFIYAREKIRRIVDDAKMYYIIALPHDIPHQNKLINGIKVYCENNDTQSLDEMLVSADDINEAMIYSVLNPPMLNHLLKRGADINYGNDQLFIDAVKVGNVELLSQLLENGANLKARNSIALYLSSKRGDLLITKFLIQNGIAMDAQRGLELFISVQENHYDIVKLLLQSDIEFPTSDIREHMFSVCIKNNNIAILKLLLEHNDDICTIGTMIDCVIYNNIEALKIFLDYDVGKNFTNDSILEIAIGYKRGELIELLLESGAEVRNAALEIAALQSDAKLMERLTQVQARVFDHTPILALVAGTGCVETAMYLISIGAKVGERSVSWAIQEGKCEMAKLLLEINPCANTCKRSIEYAVQNKQTQMVTLLLEHGVPIQKFVTSFSMAAYRGHIEIVQVLLLHNICAQESALASAAEGGHIKIVALLLEQRLGMSADDQSISRAINGRHVEVVKLLLAHKIKITPSSLQSAIYYQQFEMVKLLLENGADISKRDVQDAFRTKNVEIILLLLENGGCINDECVADIVENLRIEDDHKNIELFNILLDNGASITDEYFKIICSKGCHELAAFLLKRGNVVLVGVLESVCSCALDNVAVVKVLLAYGASVTDDVIKIAQEKNHVSILQLFSTY